MLERSNHARVQPAQVEPANDPAGGASKSRISLFRSEVMLARGSQWMGAIRLAQPLSIRIVVGLALVITLCILVFIAFGSITRKARVTGMTLPVSGSLMISSSSPGILARSFVKEGQSVHAGQALFELSTERQGSGGELSTLVGRQLGIQRQALASERRTRLVQHRARSQALTERLSNLDAEALQLDQEIALSHRRLKLATASVDKFLTLQDSGFVSAAQTQQKQEELIDLSTRASTLARTKLQLQSTRLNLSAEQSASAGELDSLLAQLDRSDAGLNRELAENQGRKTSLVLAPQAGSLSTIIYGAGQSVAPGQTLAVLMPRTQTDAHADALEVQLFAPSRMLGFVAPGQTVLIRYQAFPYQKFGLHAGRVTDISSTPFAPADLPPHLASTILSNAQQGAPGANNSEGLFRIRVALARQHIDVYGKPQPLRAGMTLDADIVQDRRRIWEWIAAPLLAARQR